MKKFVAVLAVLLVVLGVSAAVAEDAEVPAYTCGDYQYQLLDDGTAMITKCNDDAKKIKVPSELDGHTVTGIGDNAFYGCYGLTTISMPDTITSIADHAFYGCFNLDSVTIPDSVTHVGVGIFSYCANLVNIVVSPDHPMLATIDGVLFDKISKTLIRCPVYNAENYKVPDGIVCIGEYAFHGSYPTSITISDSVTQIDVNAFDACFNLTDINVTSTNSTFCTTKGVLFDKESKTLIRCPESFNAEVYEVANGITSIGEHAFFKCTNLTSVTIANSVISIDRGAFSNCNKLTHITLPNKISSISAYTFSNCKNLTSIAIPDSVASIGDYAFYYCKKLTSIAFPKSISAIGNRAFSGCSSLTTITIPASVTSIGEDAFSDCPNLTLTVTRDSYAAQWCKDNGVPYTYPDANDWLNN